MKLSPALFITLETLLLLPSLIFMGGVLEYYFYGTGNIIQMVTGTDNFIKGFFVTLLTPFAAGFLAYNYIERYKIKPFIKLIAKLILFYAIIEIGLVIIFSLFLLLRLNFN